MKELRLLAVVALVLALAAFGVANTAVDAKYWVELEPSNEPGMIIMAAPVRYSDELVFSNADYIFEGRVKGFTEMAYYLRVDGRTHGPTYYTKYDVEVLDGIYPSNPAHEGEVSIFRYGNSYAKYNMIITINVGDTYIFIADEIADDHPYSGAGLYAARDLYSLYPIEDSTAYVWHEVPIGDMQSPLHHIKVNSFYDNAVFRTVGRETAKEGLRALAETYNAGGTR